MEYFLAQVNNSCGAYENLATIIYTSAGGTSVFVCLLAIILVITSGLHRQLVYRLALYQGSSSLAFGLSCVLQLIYMHCNEDVNTYSKVCISVGWPYSVYVLPKAFLLNVDDESSVLIRSLLQEF